MAQTDTHTPFHSLGRAHPGGSQLPIRVMAIFHGVTVAAR